MRLWSLTLVAWMFTVGIAQADDPPARSEKPIHVGPPGMISIEELQGEFWIVREGRAGTCHAKKVDATHLRLTNERGEDVVLAYHQNLIQEGSGWPEGIVHRAAEDCILIRWRNNTRWLRARPLPEENYEGGYFIRNNATGQLGDTLVYRNGGRLFARNENRRVTELTPTDKSNVWRAVEWGIDVLCIQIASEKCFLFGNETSWTAENITINPNLVREAAWERPGSGDLIGRGQESRGCAALGAAATAAEKTSATTAVLCGGFANERYTSLACKSAGAAIAAAAIVARTAHEAFCVDRNCDRSSCREGGSCSERAGGGACRDGGNHCARDVTGHRW